MSSKAPQTKTKSNDKQKSTLTGTETSSAEASPWAPASDYLIDLYKSGSDALAATRNKIFGGDFVTPANAIQRSSVGALTSVAPQLAGGATDLRTIASRIASGEFLDPTNPVLQASIKAVQDPVALNWANMVQPQITDAAMKGGAYGGTAQALLDVEGASRLNRDLLNTGATMTGDWMNRRFSDLAMTPELLKTANVLSLAPGAVLAQAGDYERSLDDFATQDALARYRNELESPWFGVDNMTRLLTAGGFGQKTAEGTSKTSGTIDKSGNTVTKQPAPDMMTQILQGGLGGLSTLASLGQAFPSTMAGLGGLFGLGGAGATAAGAVGGGISSMLPILAALSDRRYKTDIVRIGYAENGLPIYRFRYVGARDYNIGFMADEVEKLIPDAVFTNPDGVKYVDYQRATEMR